MPSYARIERTVEEVAKLLAIEPRGVKITFIDDAHAYAQTSVAYPPAVPEIRIPERLLDDRSLVAHEICHALVPNRHLLLSEGLSTYVGLRFGGCVSDFGFAPGPLDEIVLEHLDRYTCLSELAGETTDNRRVFNLAQSHYFRYRFAHLCGASFAAFLLRRRGDLASQMQAPDCPPPARLVENMFGVFLEEMEQLWLSEVGYAAALS